MGGTISRRKNASLSTEQTVFFSKRKNGLEEKFMPKMRGSRIWCTQAKF
jgi:hypothetical protein